MNGKNAVKIGVIPIRRASLSLENAIAQKKRIVEKLEEIKPEEIKLVNIDGVIESGVLWDDYENMQKVMNKMQEEKPDAVFTPHCDFGTEETVGKLCRAIGKPVLLWGEKDRTPVPGQLRPTDTQCGLFASSKALQRNGVPFSYIINSELDSHRFVNGFNKFAAVASVAKCFGKLRIAQVSLRPKQFMSVMYNEDELLSRFGIEVVPVSAAYVKKKMEICLKERSSQVDDTIDEVNKRINCSATSQAEQRNIAALKLALVDIAGENDCCAVALECWSLFFRHMSFRPCLVVGELTDMGIPVSCETDVLGAVSSVILNAAAFGKKPTFFADLTIRHPQNDNAELLWHCGPFPYSLKAPESGATLVNGLENWSLKKGDITIARFDGLQGKYGLLSGEGRAVEGPETTGTYVWFEVDDWDQWEEKVINGPYIHHVSGIYGNYSEILNEACKYMPGVVSDSMKQHAASL